MQKLFKYINALVIVILLGVILSSCNTGTSTSNPPNGLDDILNSSLQEYGGSQYFSSISATVQCGDKAPVNGTVGTMAVNGSVPIDTNSISQIGSITKSFNAVVLLQLASESQYNFSLNDTMGKWFPEYPQWENITIIQLLNMSSGIHTYTTIPFVMEIVQNPYTYMPPQSLVASVESLPLMFAPGTEFFYSNTNYILTGMLVEKITGNSPMVEIQNRIINKLHLTNTYFPVNLPASVAPIAQLTNGYLFESSVSESNIYNITLWQLSWAYTDGAIISTPTDINTYVHALFNPGPLLTQSEINSMESNLISISPPYQHVADVSESVQSAFGLGITKGYTPAPAGNFYYYTGGTLGFVFTYMYYPALNMDVVFTTNSSQSGDSLNSRSESLFEYTVTTQCGESIPFYTPPSQGSRVSIL